MFYFFISSYIWIWFRIRQNNSDPDGSGFLRRNTDCAAIQANINTMDPIKFANDLKNENEFKTGQTSGQQYIIFAIFTM